MAEFSTAKLLSRKLSPVGVAAFAFSLTFSGQSSAAINVNPLGDSMTLGTNDVAADIGGYRFYYQDLVASNPLFDLNFIGNRVDATSNHWGVGGAQAQNDRDRNNTTEDTPGMLRAVHNITADPSSEFAAFNPANGKLDAIFLHAGTNSVPGPTNESNSLGSEFGVNNAFTSMKNLLLAGTAGVSANVSGGETLATITNASGIHAQLNNNLSVTNGQSHVFVAGIIPLFEDFGLYGNDDQAILDVYNGVGNYNSQVKNLLDTNGTLNDAGSTVTYHYVDMFSITVDELDLNWLASHFTDTDNDVTQSDIDALLALISPDAEDSGPDYVDWGLGFDELTWDEGALGIDEAVYAGFNTNLIGDGVSVSGVHATDLGYAVMANVWYNASVGVLVPEPSSLILIMVGSSLLVARRRRSLQI